MKGLINILKSRYFLIGFGMCLLVSGVLMLGSWLGWSMQVQMLAIVAILVLSVLLLAVNMARANKNAALIEQSLKAQAQHQRMSSRPDRAAEVEELQKQLEAAIERLKQSKLGRGRSGKAALYALPWYMFIGPPGTGKTTAIANSGMNFPLGTNRIRGVGGTRNCDWFFTDSAILLDTAGRYMTEAEDTEEWHAFLETLKKHRPDRPINGIIIGISMADLAGSTPDEIEWHAANIRHRIDELLGRLGVRFPVYLLFTKADLLQGFTEFFGEFSRKERDQIWGCTLDSEQQRHPDVRVVFEREYQQLYDMLLNLRTHRLGQTMKREDRHKVYVFPLEFSSVRDNLSLFVSRLFQPNPYQESPVFRGFYFTSGTQEGAPIDRVIQAIAQQFDLPPAAAAGFDREVETKSYFIKDLFTDVIIPDQYMVRQSSRTATRGRVMQAGVGVAALVVLGLFALATSQALLRSMGDLDATQTAASAIAEVNWADPSALPEELAAMDGLREQVAGLEEYDVDPPLLRLGLYRGGTVLAPARDLYFDRMNAFVERYAFRSLERQLSSGANVMGLMADNVRDSLYNDLRAYLLLTSESGRLRDETNRRFLGRHLAVMTSRMAGYGLPSASAESVPAQIAQQAEYYAERLDSARVPFQGSADLVQRTRARLRSGVGDIDVMYVYTQLKEEAELTLQPFTLEQALQGRGAGMLVASYEVPGFFTKQGWEGRVKEAITTRSEDPNRVDWVLGLSEQDLSAELLNPDDLEQRLTEIYFNEYAASWERFLRSVRLSPFRDIATASRGLAELGSEYDSPLLYLLAQVSNQTHFPEESLADDLAGRVGNAAERRADQASRRALGADGAIDRAEEEEQLHPVDRRFRRLHDLEAGKAPSGGASANLTRSLESLRTIGSVLDGMAGDGAKAADYAQGILSRDGGELRSTVDAIQSALGPLDSEVRRALFVEPVYNAWEMILGEARQFLNDQWRDQVVSAYSERLAGRYPLDLNSQQDVPIDDFQAFFHPQTGPLAVFFAETLEPFLGRDGRTARTWEGRGITVSPEVIRAREQAQQIAAGLYSGGVLKLDFRLQPDIPDRAPGAPSTGPVEMQIHGRGDVYRGGAYRPAIQVSWPGAPGARIQVSTQAQPVSMELPGAWAWFRMVQAAQVEAKSATDFTLRWPLADGITARADLTTQSSNHPFANLRAFFNFPLPEALTQ